jgi:hypothetical protein
MRLAEAIVALVDTEKALPPIHRTQRDHVWSNEVKAIVVAEVEVGHARYRFGDVLDLALRNAPSEERSQAS